MKFLGRERLNRLFRLAVFTLIALGVVLLIPRATGQTGAAPAPGAPAAPAAADLPWRPFIDPINVHESWFLLLVPMAFGVAVVYKAVRMQELNRYWMHVIYMTAQIVIAMILLGAATYLIVIRFAPFIASY
ncbi:MAG: hypothetical protein IT438_10310 [Phycisphaerales bacterium]|nr:hypothetical protein [Phycisphaerales bacterium]